MNNNKPLVSVIVLTYNQEHTVGLTLDSILSQRTDFAFEIVIGEDASPSDNTRAVCEAYATKYPDIVRLMPKAANKGLMRNYADCLRSCKGEYIAGCAGDDYWICDDKLQMQVDFLEAHPDYVLVHTDMRTLDVATGKEYTPPIRTNIPEGDVRVALYGKPFVKAPTVCYRRSEVTSELLDDLWQQNFLLEDMPMWLILSRNGGKFHFMPHYTVMYRISGNSVCNNDNVDKRVAFLESAYNVLRYYNAKFNLNIKSNYIEKRYANEIPRILIATKQTKYISQAVRRFGVIRVIYIVMIMFSDKLSQYFTRE